MTVTLVIALEDQMSVVEAFVRAVNGKMMTHRTWLSYEGGNSKAVLIRFLLFGRA